MVPQAQSVLSDFLQVYLLSFVRILVHPHVVCSILDAKDHSQGWISPEIKDGEHFEQVRPYQRRVERTINLGFTKVKFGQVEGSLNPYELWNIVRIKD